MAEAREEILESAVSEERGPSKLISQAAELIARVRQRARACLVRIYEQVVFWLDPGLEDATGIYEGLTIAAKDAIAQLFPEDAAATLANMDPETREEAVISTVSAVSRVLGVELECIQIADTGSVYGWYSWHDNLIRLNAKDVYQMPMKREEARELLDTILHELFHAYQRCACLRPSRYGIDQTTAIYWRTNFRNYVQFDQNPIRHLDQPLEVDATRFAGLVVGLLETQGGASNEGNV